MAQRWVNFAEVRQKVSLSDVLFTYYGIEQLTDTGNGRLVGPCPVHGGDNPRAFHADLKRNIWHCFTRCHGGGNQLDFVVAKDDVSVREAALRLQEFFLSGEAPQSSQSSDTSHTHSEQTPRSAGARAVNPPLSLRLGLAHDHPYIRERGLTEETARFFDVGYCSRGLMRGCVAFPIFNEDEELVAYAGRRLKPKDIEARGKYLFPKGFKKHLVLYNFNEAKKLAHTQGLILVEGFFSVFAVYQAGFRNVVASMGVATLSQEQEALIRSAEPPSLSILANGNASSRESAIALASRFANAKTTVRIVHLPTGRDPADLSMDTLLWVLSGLEEFDISTMSFELDRDV